MAKRLGSIDNIVSDIKQKMQISIIDMQNKVYDIIDEYLKAYYNLYDPVAYDRTYQLMKSLVKSEIVPTNNGFKARVYYDWQSLDYTIKSVNGYTIKNKGWDAKKTMDSAAKGSHGGYTTTVGGEIWDTPLQILDRQGLEQFRKSLIQAGIPLK